VAPRRREPARIAGSIAVVNEPEVEPGIAAELEGLERCIVGIIGATFRHRKVEELDRPLDTGSDRVGHLDHDAGVAGLHHMLVGRAAVAQVKTEFDCGRHGVADLGEYIEGLGTEVDIPLSSLSWLVCSDPS
jgi:hypothetical protein